MSSQLALFSTDRYHDPRVAADRARARSLAKLRSIRRTELTTPPSGVVVQLPWPVDLHVGDALQSRHAA